MAYRDGDLDFPPVMRLNGRGGPKFIMGRSQGMSLNGRSFQKIQVE